MTSTDNNWQDRGQTSARHDWIVHRVAETGSTNIDLYSQAERGAEHHTALMADNQTAGRGRLDRTWEAKSGANLLVSLLFRNSNCDVSMCQRVVAVSAVRACRIFFDETEKNSASVKLKWPNDLLLNEKKFGGMLSVADPEQTFIVVGIGINIAWAPDYAAKLKDFATVKSFSPADLLNVMIEQIDISEKYSKDQFEYQVRNQSFSVPLYHESLSHNKIRKISLPHYQSQADLVNFLYRENLPGYFPFTAGVFPFKRTEEDPKRMFAGEGTPTRTNKRFHLLCRGEKAKRLSTAFDSAKKKRDSVVYPEAAEPNFAVPTLPSAITTINVSDTATNKGGDRG